MTRWWRDQHHRAKRNRRYLVTLDAVAGALQRDEMSTAATRIQDAGELDNPNVGKVVVNAAGRALYFSRRTIPYS